MCKNLAQLLFFQNSHVWKLYNMFKKMSKLTKMYSFPKGCVWVKIVEEEIYCARLAQLSTTFVFRKSHFWKLFVKTNFDIDKNVYIFKRIRLRENCWGRNSLCLPSTTQHSCFFQNSHFLKLNVSTNFEIICFNFNFSEHCKFL